jgi:hypothetical protein
MVSVEVREKLCVINILVRKCSEVADTQGGLTVKSGEIRV